MEAFLPLRGLPTSWSAEIKESELARGSSRIDLSWGKRDESEEND